MAGEPDRRPKLFFRGIRPAHGNYGEPYHALSRECGVISPGTSGVRTLAEKTAPPEFPLSPE